MNRFFLLLAFWSSLLCFSQHGAGQESPIPDSVRSWTNEQTAFVAVFDLQSFKAKEPYNRFKAYASGLFKETLTSENELTRLLPEFEKGLDSFDLALDELSAAGAGKAFLLFNSSVFDNENYDIANAPFLLVVPFDAKQADAFKKADPLEKIGQFLPLDQVNELKESLYVQTYDDCLVFANNGSAGDVSNSPELLQEMKKLMNGKLNARIVEWYKTVKSAPIQACIVQTDWIANLLSQLNQGLINETTPELIIPSETTLVDALQSVSLTIGSDEAAFWLSVVAKDETAASQFAEFLQNSKSATIKNATSDPTLEDSAPIITDLLNAVWTVLTPQQEGAALTWNDKSIADRFNRILPQLNMNPKAGLREDGKYTKKDYENAKRIYELAKPWLNKNTIALIHLDTAELNLKERTKACIDQLRKLLPETLSAENPFMVDFLGVVADLDSLAQQLKAAGGRDIFAFIEMNERRPVFFVVPFDPEKKEQAEKLLNLSDCLESFPTDLRAELEETVFARIYENNLIYMIPNDPSSLYPSNADETFEAFLKSVPKNKPYYVKQVQYALLETARSPFQVVVTLPAQTRASALLAIPTLPRQLETSQSQLAAALRTIQPELIKDSLRALALELNPYELYWNLHLISRDEEASINAAEFLQALKPVYAQAKLQAILGLQESSPEFAAIFNNFNQTLGCLSVDLANEDYRLYEPQQNGPVLSIRSSLIQERSKNSSINIQTSAVAGVLIGLTLPAVQSARNSARRMQSLNRFKQIALAMLVYEQKNRHLPPAYTVDKSGKPLHSWRVLLLPYFDQQELYDQIRLDEPWNSEYNKQFFDKCPQIYQNVLAPSNIMTTFCVVVGENTAFPPNGKTIRISDFTDGTSNTILVTEGQPVCWMDPKGDIPFDKAFPNNTDATELPDQFMTTNGLLSAAFCDSCVRSFSPKKIVKYLRLLFLRNDGKNIDWDSIE